MPDQRDRPPTPTPKSTPRLSRASVKVLRQWLDTHTDHPYPTEPQKSQLRQDTGLTITQISNWFTNARRRGKVSSSGWKDVSIAKAMSNISTLDRWRHSPPELEPASWSAIASALAEASDVSCTKQPTEAHYQASTEASSSGPSDVSSAWASTESESSTTSCRVRQAQALTRRRRRRKKEKLAIQPENATCHRKYQCTFCTDSFKTKYDWTRHESTQHLALEQWTCIPYGSTRLVPGSSSPMCVFCDKKDPSEAHIDSHRYFDCAEQSSVTRTFYRKDHLRQHLMQFHAINTWLPSMNEWRSKITKVHSRCGFCGETFEDWPRRNDHLAAHFRNGATMKDWKGCRGLRPQIAMHVQHAMPPYLIASEAGGVNPFSADNGNTQGYLGVSLDNPRADLRQQHEPTSFEILVARLSEYVNEQKVKRLVPTDQMLQRQARMIVYGHDDAWDQTAADNAQWLELFKMGHGIESTSGEPQVFPDVDGIFQLPWYWQSPECLAEFRASKETPDLAVWPDQPLYSICQASDWDNQNLVTGTNGTTEGELRDSLSNPLDLMPFDMDINGLFDFT